PSTIFGLFYHSDQSETDQTISFGRQIITSSRRTAHRGGRLPTATAIDFHRAAWRALRVFRRAGFVVIEIVPVLEPFADVAMHIEKPRQIRLPLPDRVWMVERVRTEPGDRL